MADRQTLIDNTKKWIQDVVIGCNFCPFAAKEVKQGTVRYHVEEDDDLNACLQVFLNECELLDTNPEIETTIIILPIGFDEFEDYLDLVECAEEILEENGYEGTYQVATFHPNYCFEGEEADDASNFTNRSPYPMLHILREESVERALERYPDAEGIPQRNIDFARTKGSAYMKMLRDACL
ncbi:MAG: DUF1415 domain-containing protein [Bacteroidetes bacterium]|nr:DUF1415 domain-containing protein [Bacteroidota bacterium]